MYYDLHIHSALSPCSDDDMTVNNIVSMACLIGLDLIAITDHNSLRQLDTLEDICKDRISFLYGVEINSKENVHVLGYFDNKEDVKEFQSYLDQHLLVKKNNPEFYGNQLIFDIKDEVIDIEERLLIQSLDESIEQIIDKIHACHGAAVLAHALNNKYSITSVFGRVSNDLDYDGIEVKSIDQINTLKLMNPNLKETIFLIDSDAHMLSMISERENNISKEELEKMFRRPLCKI